MYMQKESETGHLRTVYIPDGLDTKLEQVKSKLQWSRSYLYKYALTKFLQELSLLTEAVHEKTVVVEVTPDEKTAIMNADNGGT